MMYCGKRRIQRLLRAYESLIHEPDGKGPYQVDKDTDRFQTGKSNVVDIDLLFVAELERALALLLAEGIGLVDLGVFWQLTIRLHCGR